MHTTDTPLNLAEVIVAERWYVNVAEMTAPTGFHGIKCSFPPSVGHCPLAPLEGDTVPHLALLLLPALLPRTQFVASCRRDPVHFCEYERRCAFTDSD